MEFWSPNSLQKGGIIEHHSLTDIGADSSFSKCYMLTLSLVFSSLTLSHHLCIRWQDMRLWAFQFAFEWFDPLLARYNRPTRITTRSVVASTGATANNCHHVCAFLLEPFLSWCRHTRSHRFAFFVDFARFSNSPFQILKPQLRISL